MSKNFKLVSALHRGTWLIDKRYAENAFPLVARFLAGEPVSFFDDDEDKEEAQPYAVSLINGKVSKSTFDAAPAGSVAVIPVIGPVMKEDFCGAPGTSTLKKWVTEADSHPNIIASILHIDSPGGSVDGTFEFSDAIKATVKPVVTWGDGLIASAGYAIASPSNEIIMSHKTAEIGSIGTMITLTDNTEALKEWGYVRHNIRATGSFDKNEEFYQAKEGNYVPLVEQILDPTNDIFLQTVKENRSGKLQLKEVKHPDPKVKGQFYEPLTGKIYLAEEAIELGLADAIGTFEYAVQRATELAEQQQSTYAHKQNLHNQKDTSMKRFLSSAWTALIALCGFTLNGEQTNEEFTDEHLAKVDAELARLQAREKELSTQLQEKETLISSQAADLARANEKIQGLEAKVAELGAQPGAMASNPVKAGTDKIDEASDSIVDMEAEHNKSAARFTGKA